MYLAGRLQKAAGRERGGEGLEAPPVVQGIVPSLCTYVMHEYVCLCAGARAQTSALQCTASDLVKHTKRLQALCM